jgi:hypothetical protein
MTEQIEGVRSAQLDTVHHRIVRKGPLGAETSAVPPKPANLTWEKTGQGHLIGEYPKTTAATDGFISELRRLYKFRDDLVESFLEENPSLGSLLFEAYKIIPDHFGSEVETALEVVADPEAPEDRELFVVIRTELPPMKARALLSELDQGWWRDVSPVAEGKMEFALE